MRRRWAGGGGKEWSACGGGGVQREQAIGFFLDCEHCILNLQVCLPVVDGQQTLGLWTRRGETETTVKGARCTNS
jgi:hypothetical protein